MTTHTELANLFTALCNELADQIENGKTVATKDGDTTRVSPDASLLNVARQLLKDNGIEADRSAEDGPLSKVRNALPFPSVEEVHGELH